MTDANLQNRLEGLLENADGVPSDAWQLVCQMLEPQHLGHPDPYFRDTLVFSTLANWIVQGVLSVEQLRTVLSVLTDNNHLFFRLGEVGAPTVLVRSFAVLQLASILDRHLNHPCLTRAELSELLITLVRYLEGEKDLRGYDVSLGWLHAAAHTADALLNLSRCDELSLTELGQVFSGLQFLAGCGFHGFTEGEDERLAAAMHSTLLRTELTPVERLVWLDTFTEQVQTCFVLGMPTGYTRFMNIKHTLRALYFLFGSSDPEKSLKQHVERLIYDFAKL